MTITQRIIHISTVAGLLMAMAIYIIGGTALATTAVFWTQETVLFETAALRHVDMDEVKNSRADDDTLDDAVLFLPGFGAPLEKQVRHRQ